MPKDVHRAREDAHVGHTAGKKPKHAAGDASAFEIVAAYIAQAAAVLDIRVERIHLHAAVGKRVDFFRDRRVVDRIQNQGVRVLAHFIHGRKLGCYVITLLGAQDHLNAIVVKLAFRFVYAADDLAEKRIALARQKNADDI